MNDTQFMQLALELARQGEGFTSPNPMVGAVVVQDGRVVGRGYHQYVGGPHAEVNAIEDAGARACGATLYVTLEPCNHQGRTPPCTAKILAAGIRRVVVAMDDPNPDVCGGGNDYLASQGVQITRGICEAEAWRLNEAFVKYSRTQRPFVILKCAATLDGRIATKTGDSKWVTGPAARQFVHRLRHAVDGIMVGVGTVQQDDPSLTTRLEGMKGVDPTRIVLDTRLSTPLRAKLLRLASDAPTLILTGRLSNPDARKAYQDQGARVLEVPAEDGRIDLNAAMARLGKLGLTSILIEGGSQVAASSLAAGVVDKVCFFYAPKILGGDDGIPMCAGPGPALMAGCIPVRHVQVRRFDDDILIEGYIRPAQGGG